MFRKDVQTRVFLIIDTGTGPLTVCPDARRPQLERGLYNLGDLLAAPFAHQSILMKKISNSDVTRSEHFPHNGSVPWNIFSERGTSTLRPSVTNLRISATSPFGLSNLAKNIVLYA